MKKPYEKISYDKIFSHETEVKLVHTYVKFRLTMLLFNQKDCGGKINHTALKKKQKYNTKHKKQN